MDDIDAATSPILFMIVGGIALVLFFYLYQSTRKKLDQAAAPRRSLSYECVATPIDKADAELRGKFPELAKIDSESGVALVRFGLFNWGELALEEDQIVKPVTVVFPDDTHLTEPSDRVLGAKVAELGLVPA